MCHVVRMHGLRGVSLQQVDSILPRILVPRPIGKNRAFWKLLVDARACESTVFEAAQ